MSQSADFPSPVVEPKKKGLSLVWLVPLIAILVGAGLVVRTLMERGPDITVSFKNADGNVGFHPGCSSGSSYSPGGCYSCG